MKKIQDLDYSAKTHIQDGLVIGLIGLLLLIFQSSFPRLVLSWTMNTLLILCLLGLLARPWRQRKSGLGVEVRNTLIVAVLAYGTWFETFVIYLLVILMGFYQVMMAAINAITYWIYRKDRTPHRLNYLWDALWLGLVGFAAIFAPFDKDANGSLLILGIYLLGLAWTNIRDGLIFDTQAGRQNLKRRVRVSLPIVFTALVPATVLRKINTYLDQNQGADAEASYNEDKGQTVDLSIFVHTSPASFFGAMGHVDIAYKGTVYAYGNYDLTSLRLFGSVGDGVLFTTPAQLYVPFCQKEDSKTIFEYGLSLSEEARLAVEARLAEIAELTQPFAPVSDPIDKKQGQPVPMYSYRIQEELGGHCYKFTGSKFKTYFVMSTNCVLLADSIVGKAGTDILSPRGIITPGTYQEYLDREYERPHSIVVSRKVHYTAVTKD